MAFVAPVSFGNGTMGGRPRISLDPLIPVVRNIFSDVNLMRPLKSGIDCLDSGPLLNVSLVSLKSAPFAFFENNVLVKEFDNGISCRMRYLEAAVMATASCVYNFVFATVFSVLSLVTLGQVKMLTDQMRKLWTHTALAAASAAIGAVGAFSPKLGIQANLAAGLAIGIILFQGMESGVVRSICTAYRRHRPDLQNAAMQCAQGNVAFYDREIAPFFNYLDANLNDRVQTLSDLLEVAQNSRERINVGVFASPDVLLDNGMQLLAHLSRGQRPEAVTS